jgi:hypothetical protein
LLRPLESERGNAFPLDKAGLAELNVKEIYATATNDELVAIVGKDAYVDLSSSSRTEQGPRPLPAR